MSKDFPQSCPECQQNKHLNCDGTTWNPATDEPDRCPCEKRGHDVTVHMTETYQKLSGQHGVICRCGWSDKGQTYRYRSDARAAGDAHLEEANA